MISREREGRGEERRGLGIWSDQSYRHIRKSYHIYNKTRRRKFGQKGIFLKVRYNNSQYVHVSVRWLALVPIQKHGAFNIERY